MIYNKAFTRDKDCKVPFSESGMFAVISVSGLAFYHPFRKLQRQSAISKVCTGNGAAYDCVKVFESITGNAELGWNHE